MSFALGIATGASVHAPMDAALLLFDSLSQL